MSLSFQIRPAESFKTAAMFFYFFLTIALIYVLKPARNALFLEELGAKNLRYIYMGEGLFLAAIVSLYIWLARKVPRRLFFPGILLFCASNLAIFWFLFRSPLSYLSAYFYIWVSSFSITSTTQFWMLANDIFKPEEAKRLFGLIISGGSFGGVSGGLLTRQLLKFLKTEDLLLVAAGLIVACAFFLIGVLPKIYQGPETSFPPVHITKKTDGKIQDSKILLGSSYLIMLAMLVILPKMSSTIIDNQFSRMVELTYLGKEAKAAFFAGFLAWLNVASFLAQLLLTSLSLRFLGVSRSLFILPFGLVFFSGGTLVFPIITAALFLRIFDGSMNYSIQQASKEMLFLPLPASVRYKVKPIIDMLGFRFAKTLSGFYIALAAPLLGLADEKLGTLVLWLMPFWIFLVWKLRSSAQILFEEKK